MARNCSSVIPCRLAYSSMCSGTLGSLGLEGGAMWVGSADSGSFLFTPSCRRSQGRDRSPWKSPGSLCLPGRDCLVPHVEVGGERDAGWQRVGAATGRGVRPGAGPHHGDVLVGARGPLLRLAGGVGG